MNHGYRQILRTDPSGQPIGWVDYAEAARLIVLGEVCYATGAILYRLRGGINALTHRQSRLDVHAILATRVNDEHRAWLYRTYIPPLSNAALFRRDDWICLYCGRRFTSSHLSRDHVRPLSRGGEDSWSNAVTACKRCNNRKAGRTPEEAGMALLAVPFVPTHAEYIYLKGKRIVADQMDFLRAHFPRESPLYHRLGRGERAIA